MKIRTMLFVKKNVWVNGVRQKVSVARLIIHDTVNEQAQWSNGVQQFVHARLNHKRQADRQFAQLYPRFLN